MGEPVFANPGTSFNPTRKGKSLASRLERKGKGLSMGGTIGGATTSTPEYLTETQYYSPSEFEDVSRRGKSHETVLIGPLIDSNRQGRRKHRDGRTGDRRIDNDSHNRNSSKYSEQIENSYSDDD